MPTLLYCVARFSQEPQFLSLRAYGLPRINESFSLPLPFASNAASDTQSIPTGCPKLINMIKASSEKCRVLIVDDDHKVGALLIELIENEGYEVASAGDGGSGLELLTSFEPDVVISDVVMPVLEGIELCRRIKKEPRTADIPVLLISGNRNSVEDSIAGLTAGADDYLEVPFRNEELLVKVARLAERRRVEKHYREIVEQAADIIYTRDMDGYITSINVAGAQFFGKSPSEIVGIHLSQLLGPDTAARDIEETRKAANDSPLRSTYYVKDAANNGRYLEGV